MRASLRNRYHIIRRRLVRWFKCHARPFPWRVNRDSYRIWVSEVMLQQTQAATVIPYFERFLARFPTLSQLAQATEQDVLLLWEGLGYYRRARDLHRAARLVVKEYGGSLPTDRTALATLPGFGRYTVNAVLSQAYDLRLPIVEANSQRVLCRLFAKQGDPQSATVRGWLWKTAEDLLPRRNAGDFNQALMELGALVCTVKAPHCSVCPLQQVCGAHRLGSPEAYPGKSKRDETIRIKEIAIIIRRGRKVLLVQRPPVGRWANMWEFPHAPIAGNESWEEAVGGLLADLAGLRARVDTELLTLRHGVNNHAITLIGLLASYQAGRFRSSFYTQAKWLEPEQVAAYPVSVPQRKLAKCLLDPCRQLQLF